ncbi:MAG: hypothetical protein U5N56_04000 [Candidatus Marinimicrobia bacterium]|nr:hypothetical protein [Candidatus Neomarinimicrobiota bacterium]
MTEAPDAKKVEKTLSIHGQTRIDPYYWLRDREDPEVIDYLEKENAYTAAKMKDTRKLQKKLYKEMVARIKQDDSSVPYRKNGYLYYHRYEKGSEYPVYCRKKNENAEEEILLDVNKMAEGYAYYRISGLYVSPDNRLLAFGEDTLSRRKYTLRFIDLETGEFLPDRIENTPGSAAWANDSKTVFYNTKDKTLRPAKTYRHQLGTPAAQDDLVFHEDEKTFYHGVYRSKSGKYIMLVSESTLTSEYRFIPAGEPFSEPVIIQERTRGIEYHPSDVGEVFYILTNENAKNFKLVAAPVNAPGRENWKEIIPHRQDVLLERAEFFKDRYVVQERNNAQPRLRILGYKGRVDRYIRFDEEAYNVWIGTNREFDSETLRYGYESMTTPRTIYDHDLLSGEQILMKQSEVLGDFDPADYETRRIWANADDSTKIPMSMVYKRTHPWTEAHRSSFTGTDPTA